MLVPSLTAGVEKRLDRRRLQVDTGEVWPLVQVALRTSQGKVFFVVRPAVLLGDDMLDLICDEGLIGLASVAIFAAVARSLADPLPR